MRNLSRVPNSFLVLSVLLALAFGATASAAGDAPHGTSQPRLSLPDLPARAIGQAVIEEDTPQLTARLVVDANERGEPRAAGVLFDLAPGWHIYWRHPGGTGLAPEIDFDAQGLAIGELAWPAPETFREADGLFTTYGYEGSVLLAAPISSVKTRAGEIRAEVSALICRTQCVPAEFSLATPAAPTLPKSQRVAIANLFARTAAQVPHRAEAIGLTARAAWLEGRPQADAEGRLALAIETCAAERAALHEGCRLEPDASDHAPFIPLSEDVFELAGARLATQSADRFELALTLTRVEEGEDRLRGLLRVRDEKGAPRYVEVDVPIAGADGLALATPGSSDRGGASEATGSSDRGGASEATGSSNRGGAPEATATAPAAIPWLRIVLLALLGGLILNGMPCVLPVLAIKVVSIADLAEKDPREVRLHGLAYTAGVLGSMAALAGLVIGLRTAGHSVGWGFQFQEPLFVAGISAVLVAFALNLFGVFEIELGQGKLATVGQSSSGLSRSLFEGLLAVVLATPCTAPFLGTAVGFAFATSGFGIAAIFLAIGFGLASPFLVVSFMPSLARFIPRSGPWMLKLRGILGFCLLGTVVWLLWVIGQSGGTDAVIALGANLLVLAFLLWTFGQLQPLRSAWLGRAAAAGIAVVAVSGFNLIDFNPAENGEPDATLALESGWQPYSEQAVADAVAAGRPAFVVFTADWCITCQVNERSVIARAAVQEGFQRDDFALFKADWTRRDEGIRRKLAEFGRAGVPLYLVYSPSAPNDPQILSELLTQGEVLTALASAAGTGRS